MICRACLRARGAIAADALSTKRLLRTTLRRPLSTSTARLSLAIDNPQLSLTRLVQKPVRKHLFSTASPLASTAAQTKDPIPTSTGAPEKPSYLSEGESQ